MFLVIPEAVGSSECLSQFRDPTTVKRADESMQCHRRWDPSCTCHTTAYVQPRAKLGPLRVPYYSSQVGATTPNL